MTSSISSLMLSPAIALMNRVTFYKKFALLGIIALIAICVTLYSLYISLNQTISRSQKELEGLAFIKPLAETIQRVQQHRGLSSGILAGISELKAARSAKEHEAEAAFAAFEAHRPADTKRLESWKSIMTGWKRIQANGLQWNHTDNISAHTQLIDEMLRYEAAIADDYGLTFDPDPDVSYLAHTSNIELLEALEHLGQMRAYGIGVLGVKQASEQQKTDMNTLIALLNDTLKTLKINMEKAARYNPDMRQVLSVTYESIEKSSQQVINEMRSDILTGRFHRRSGEFYSATTAAIDNGYSQLYQSLLPATEGLIKARIQRAKSTLHTTVGAALLFLLLVAYFMAAIYYATLGNIRKLSQSMAAFSRGDMQHRVHLETHDELTQIADSFNSMADELIRLTEAEHEAADRLHAILDSSLDAMVQMNYKGEITGWNKQAEEFFGWRQEEVLVQPLHEIIIPPRYREAHLRGLKHFMATGEGPILNSRFEAHAQHRDGSEFPIELMVTSFHVGDQCEFNAFISNITERKQAEDQLRVAAVAFETHEAIMIADADSNIMRVNRTFEEVTGYSAEEVIGKNPRLLSSGRQDKAFYAGMWQTILSTGAWSGEIWNRHKSGNIYPQHMTISAVKNDQGETSQYVCIFSDISERKKNENEIHNLAFYDALTGLPNRRLLLDRLDIALSVSVRNQQYGALLFLDLDKFKTLNDTQGHDYGDMLLTEVAKRLELCVRDVDTVARFGGDEFVILLENISASAEDASQKVAHLAEKTRAVLATPYQLKEHTYHSSPSIGVCLFYGNNESIDELVKHADMAMYQAKDSGRNRVQFSDPHMQQSVEARAALESDLRRAIAGQQLQLFYQIQVDSNLRPIGAEALIRWNHPERGMVSPAQFIPIAEESSLILEIGHWVLDTACQQIAAWSKQDQTRDLVLAVNISAKQFMQLDFVEQIVAMLQKHRIESSRLKLELTESVVLDDLDFVVAKMLALRKVLGITLSLDDFGTGYSSLSYLKRLSLDQLKIDQSFVRDMITDAGDAVMVRTIIDMAQNFGLHVIAEGVETDAQLAILRQYGCMAYQGYLFSKPVPIEQFETLLKQG